MDNAEEFIEKQMEIEEEPEPEKTEQLQEPEQTRNSVLEESQKLLRMHWLKILTYRHRQKRNS